MDQLNAAKPGSWQLSPVQALMLLCAPVVGLVILALLQPREAILNRAFLGAAGALLAGAVAVYVALRSLDLEPFTEVIVPAMTDAGGMMPVALLNCIPVPTDVAAGSFNASEGSLNSVNDCWKMRSERRRPPSPSATVWRFVGMRPGGPAGCA